MIMSWFGDLANKWSMPVIVYDMDGKATFFNQALLKLIGYDNEPKDMLLVEDIFGSNHEVLKRCISEGKTLTNKYKTFTKRDGEKLIVKVDYYPFNNENKKQMGTMIIITDVVSSQDLGHIYNEHIFEIIKVGIVSLNNEGIITYINNSAERLTGVEKEEVIGKHYKGIFLDLEDYITRTIRTKENYIDKRVVINDGIKERAFIFNSSVIKDDLLDIININIYLYEITEVNEVYKQLIDHERFRLISEMAAGTAHEIRNPLTSLKGFLQLLDSSLQGCKEREYIQIMLEEIEQISHVVKEFMNLGTHKISQNRKFQISRLIKDLSKFIRSEALLREVEITLNIMTDDTTVYGDKDQIKQVFLNLLQNALHSIGKKGFINISINSYENNIYINLVDSGKGILPQNLKRIFDPFFTTKDDGTGLGLPLSKKIIHEHGGDITVSSKVNQGTAFTVRLPLYPT